jgi:tetratricopeptide (TPR) repeat protein
VSEATWQIALGALGSARAAVARVSPSRHPEDAAADLIEAWGSVETALRALLNGSPLSGQDLVREVRKREMISLTLTHSLLDFLAVRERLNDTSYQPVAQDMETAREAVGQLNAALGEAPAVQAAVGSPQTADAAQVSAQTVAPPVAPPPPPIERAPRGGFLARVPTWAWIVIAVLAIGGAGAAVLLTMGAGDELTAGRNALREGRREAARGEFERVARENPQSAEAHLFLARMAREESDYVTAKRHAEAAIRAEPQSGLANREMGTILYATGNYDLARRFLERAIRYSPDDRTAQGIMGCTLARLNQRDLAARFLNRAGPGPWSDCAR